MILKIKTVTPIHNPHLMTHPLTDDLAENIAPVAQWAGDIGDTVFRHSDMRRAADWQLEQVIEWLRSMDENSYLFSYNYSWGSDPQLDKNELIADLKKAMRPQEEI